MPSGRFEYRIVYGDVQTQAEPKAELAPPVPVEPVGEARAISSAFGLLIELPRKDKNIEHTRTHWQVSSSSEFNDLLFDVETTRHLTSLPLGRHSLEPSGSYHWRARWEDRGGRSSRWTDASEFTSKERTSDSDGDGIIDHQEVDESLDLDGDGIDDVGQEGTECIYAINNEDQLCVKFDREARFLGMLPREDVVETEGLPDNTPFGVLEMRLEDGEKAETATVRIYSSRSLPRETQIYSYAFSEGWMDVTDMWTFVDAGDSLEGELVDGGAGDMDGVRNGRVVSLVALKFSDSSERTPYRTIGIFALLAILAVAILVVTWRLKVKEGATST